MAFKKFVVEIAHMYLDQPNIKINVSANDHKGAKVAALARREAKGRTLSDVVRTHCSALKPKTGKRLSTFATPSKRF